MPAYSPYRDKLVAYMAQATDSTRTLDRFAIAKAIDCHPQTAWEQLKKYEGKFFAKLPFKHGEKDQWYYIYSPEGEEIKDKIRYGASDPSVTLNSNVNNTAPVAEEKRWRYMSEEAANKLKLDNPTLMRLNQLIIHWYNNWDTASAEQLLDLAACHEGMIKLIEERIKEMI